MGSFTAFLGGSLIIAIFSIHNSKLWQIFPSSSEGTNHAGDNPSDVLMKMDMQELLEFATKSIGKVNINGYENMKVHEEMDCLVLGRS